MDTSIYPLELYIVNLSDLLVCWSAMLVSVATAWLGAAQAVSWAKIKPAVAKATALASNSLAY